MSAKDAEEENALRFVLEFLGPYLQGSQNFLTMFGSGGTFPAVMKGEVALAAQTLLLWKSSRRIERLTKVLAILTGALVALTVVLAVLTWRLAFP